MKKEVCEGQGARKRKDLAGVAKQAQGKGWGQRKKAGVFLEQQGSQETLYQMKEGSHKSPRSV